MKVESLSLPPGWEVSRVADAFDFTKKPRGLDLGKNGSEVPFFPMEQIPLGRIKVSDHTLKPVAKLGSGTYVENGDLVVAKITPSFENGKQGIVDIEADFAYGTTEVIPVRGRPNKSDTLFLFFYLLHPEVRFDLAGKMEGSTGRQRLSKTVLGNLLIPLPPLPEQKKIARILSTVQRAIEAQERIIRTTTELKKALMHKLFTEGPRGEPQKQTEIGPIPESWEVVPLAKVIRSKLQNGAFVKKPEVGKGYLFANVIDMYRETHLDLSQLERVNVPSASVSQYWLEDGDVLLVRSSLKRDGIGQNCAVRGLLEPVFYDCHLIRIQTKPSKLIPEFLAGFWRSDIGKNDLILRSKTTTMTTINQQGISKALVPIAPTSEQWEIVETLETVDTKLLGHRKKRDSLQDLFRTLLHELMTARIRVHELELLR